ncbi:hypothetical protein ACPVPU_14705 [Sphingomonas sp. CJ99]
MSVGGQGLVAWMAALAMLGCATPVSAQTAKPVIGVESVKGGEQEVPNLRTMIETSIINTNRFTVMNAGQVEVLEKSETLCGTGMIWERGKCVRGSVKLPDYRISAQVTSVGINRSNGVNLISILAKDAPPCIIQEPYLSVDIRVTTSANQIQAGEAITLKGPKVTACDGSEPNARSAFDSLLRSIAERITQKLVLTSYPIELIDLQPGNRMMLTYGEDVLAQKQQVVVLRKGPVRTDSQGRQFPTEIQVGVAEVVTLSPSSSIAQLICTYGGGEPAIGDIARLAPAKLRAQRPAKGSTLPGECR